MTGKKAFVPLVIFAILGTTSVAWSQMTGDLANETTHAIRCSLDGFNPSYHSGFDNLAQVKKEFGFVKSPDGTWHLDESCTGGRTVRAQALPLRAQALPHGPRRVKKREP
jgi:hypothetical protein